MTYTLQSTASAWCGAPESSAYEVSVNDTPLNGDDKLSVAFPRRFSNAMWLRQVFWLTHSSRTFPGREPQWLSRKGAACGIVVTDVAAA